MKIVNDRLVKADGTPFDFRLTPNRGGVFVPSYLIMHYTGATTAASAINWFLNRAAAASAHLVIDRNGNITQMAGFKTITWHAGKSQWAGIQGLNSHSIGIELVNAGRLKKVDNEWFTLLENKKIPANEVLVARHKNEHTEQGWQIYPEAQIAAALEVATLLVQKYGLKDVLGHEDIAPIRKSDPGPAFPMNSFKARAMGRADDTLDDFRTSTELNIRSGPGSQFEPISKPLPVNTLVSLLKTEGNWAFVQVNERVHGLADLEGWVATRFLVKV